MTPDVCAAISLHDFDVQGQELDWSVSNGTGSAVVINSIFFNWPTENEELKKIELNGDKIWDDKDESPPTDITSGLKGNRQIGAGQSKTLRFYFGEDAVSTGYVLEIGFNNGCTPQQSR